MITNQFLKIEKAKDFSEKLYQIIHSLEVDMLDLSKYHFPFLNRNIFILEGLYVSNRIKNWKSLQLSYLAEFE